jgi:hypothetical protein
MCVPSFYSSTGIGAYASLFFRNGGRLLAFTEEHNKNSKKKILASKLDTSIYGTLDYPQQS